MNKKEVTDFVTGVENLVQPTDVSAISFLSAANKLLPLRLQKKLMANASKQYPYMGFVVDPYSLFFCHKITDIEAAQELLTDEYQLQKTNIFSDDVPEYYVIFGCFNAHTSAFWGSRIEMYIIAEHKETGLLSWVIVDYDTNTNSYDPKRGLISANSTNTAITSIYDGRVIVHMERDDASRKLIAEANVSKGEMKPLDQRLWLEGNLSVDYGTPLADGKAKPFPLRFDPKEVQQALHIPQRYTRIYENDWYPRLFHQKPTHVVCFPYAQHFVTDSFEGATNIQTKRQLQQVVKKLGDLRQYQGFSANPLKKQILVGMIMGFVFSVALLLYIVYDYILFH